MHHVTKRAFRLGAAALAIAIVPTVAIAHGGHGAAPLHHHFETSASGSAVWFVLGLTAAVIATFGSYRALRDRRSAGRLTGTGAHHPSITGP